MSDPQPEKPPPEPAIPKPGMHLNLIFEVGRVALSKLEMGDLLTATAEAIQKHFGYYDVSIFLLDPEAQECVLVANVGDYKGAVVRGYRQKLSVGIVGWVAQHGQTALANDVRKDPRYVVAFPGEEGLLSELAAPIRLHGKTLGVINVERREVNAFDESDVMALETLSDQVAQAIANAQLFEQTRLLLDLNRSILDAVPSSLCVLDGQRRILFANPRFCQFFARREEQIRGVDIREVIPESLLREAGLEAAIHEAAGRAEPILCPGVALGGGEARRLLNVHVARAQMPEAAGVLLLFEDITEWQKAAALAEERRALLDLIVAHARVAVITFGLDGKLTFWRSGAERLFGYSEPEVIGQLTLGDLTVGPPALAPLIEQCRRTGSAEGELTIRRKSDSQVPVLCVLGKLLDRSSQHVGYTAVLLDIAERRRAADELLREKHKLEHVVDLIGAGLALIGKDRRILWSNRAISEWFGRGENVEGKLCHEVYCRRGRQCSSCAAEQCFVTGTNSEMDIALIRSDGALRQYHHAVTPILGPDGQVDHVLKLTLDVTDQTKKVYQLSRLRTIGGMMQGVLDLDRLLHFVLTCVTAGQALGFNRALLLLVDKDRSLLEGKMGVGPASAEEAGRIWSRISREAPTLEDLLQWYDRAEAQAPTTMDRVARSIRVPLDRTSHIAVACAFGRQPIIVSRSEEDPRVDEEFRRALGSREFVLAPLIARGEPVGVIVADNLYSGQPISGEHVELLSMFANQAAIAIENAGIYQRLQEEKRHLEEAYRDLAEAEDKLVRSERLGAIGRMAAHVAHEIRNPLVTIGGFANSILEHPETPREEVFRYLKIIVSEVRRLENILARVMDFTRPPKPILREGLLQPIIRDTVEPLREQARKQQVEIRLELPADDLPLQFDADQMKQVFLNLCKNALDVMTDGGRLTIQAAHLPDAERIVVANTGDPIRPADLSRLFEPFFTTKPGGTGLGLAVTQRIVHDHGGSIRAVSNVERGTEFIIALPRKRTP